MLLMDDNENTISKRIHQGWGEIEKVPGLRGGVGWDIVLRLDGTYFPDEKSSLGDPDRMVEHWRRIIYREFGERPAGG
jgi:hypothetical protein